jgi:hypothetical protein
VATGNHLLVDAAASVLVVVAAIVLARRRPWSLAVARGVPFRDARQNGVGELGR